jgi:GT2 family glycosyltransferase
VASASQIGIVTVTYNSAEVLPDFFASLVAQTCREFTLYVVDNASKDRTLEMCRERTDLPIVLIANDANLGVAEGNNQGIGAALDAGCEYVLLLNNDTVFDGRLLAGLRDGLHQYQCDMATPKIFYHDAPKKIWAAGGYFQPWLGYRAMHFGDGELDLGQYEQVRPVDYAPTCCVMMHRHVFELIGLMDTTYFVYSDDVDFMLRAMRAGLVMQYLPAYQLSHKVNSLTGTISQFTIRYCTRNRIYFLRKNLPQPIAAFWVLQYFAYYFFRYLIRKDNETVWAWKRNAASEGLRLQLNRGC